MASSFFFLPPRFSATALANSLRVSEPSLSASISANFAFAAASYLLALAWFQLLLPVIRRPEDTPHALPSFD